MSTLEKIARGLFGLFRNKHSDHKMLKERIAQMEETLKQAERVYLDSEYHLAFEKYFSELVSLWIKKDAQMTNDDFNAYKEQQVAALNRLQKIKNTTGYKKTKYKRKTFEEGWE